MANKSGSSGVISPPKGGGALQGIGEKFSPDLFTSVPRYDEARDVFILSCAEGPGYASCYRLR
jgi:hypothetical protein